MKRIKVIICIIFLCGCGISTQYAGWESTIPLRTYRNVYLRSSQALIHSDELTAHLNKALKQKPLFESLKLEIELAKIGFTVVDDETEADAYVDFNIGLVQFDAKIGWIADKASVQFVDAKTHELIISFFAHKRFIPPTADTLIKTLAARIRDHY